MKKNNLPDVIPKDIKQWRNWLIKNGATAHGVWCVMAKKKSGIPSITVVEAIDEALCHGWIDSLPQKRDDKYYALRFSPRNPKSNWSKRNKDRIALLEKEQRIFPAGYAMIQLAKSTGTWHALNDVDAGIIPQDLQVALNKNPLAKNHFLAFPHSARRGILEWLFNAKRATTRANRIEKIVSKAAINERAL